MAAAEKDFHLVYGETDPNAVFEVTPAALPKSVLSAEDTTSIVDVINLLHCGVFAMDRRLPRLPALSASLGTIETREDVLASSTSPRRRLMLVCRLWFASCLLWQNLRERKCI